MNFEMAAEMLRGPPRHGAHQRRCGGRELDLHHRPARRRRHRGRREDRRRCRRSRCRARGAQGAGRSGQWPDPLDGRGAHLLHRARRRPPDLRARPTTRWRWAWASMASPAAAGCRCCRPTPSPRRCSAPITAELGAAGGTRSAACQRLRRHAADGALSDVRRGAAPPRGQGPDRRAARWSATTARRWTWPAARSR